MKGRRRIAVVTGTRAEYGMLRSLLRAVNDHASLDLQLLVAGTHLVRAFGATAREITRDGFSIAARIRLQDGGDGAQREAEGMGRAVTGFAQALGRLDSDVVVVLGDRVEAMAGAIAAVCSRRILAHIHGGDVAPGDIDDGLRHAISKLAHVHFAATRQAFRRLVRMGEDPERVHMVGSLALDELQAASAPAPAWCRNRLALPARGTAYALVVQHPIGDSPHVESQRLEDTLAGVADAGLWPVVIYPNSDPGHSGIINVIEHHRRKNRLSAFRSLPRTDYLAALIGAQVLVGNSSSGMIESASAGTPAINIGPRQTGRQRCSRSVRDCPYGRAAVGQAIRQALAHARPSRRTSVYGDGRAGPRIARILAGLRITKSLRSKRIRY